MNRNRIMMLAASMAIGAAALMGSTPFGSVPSDHQARVIRQAETAQANQLREAPPDKAPATGAMDRQTWLNTRRGRRDDRSSKNRRPGERAHRKWRLSRSSGRKAA